MIPSFTETYFYYFVSTLLWALILFCAVGPIAIGVALGCITNNYNWFYFCLSSFVTVPLCRTIFVFNKIQDNNKVAEDGEDNNDQE
jgi:hypothetical protein